MLDAIRKRRSIRKFLSKDVEQEKLDEVLAAAMYSPSAMHGRPWEFIVIRDKETKAKLSKATPWLGFAKDAPVLLVICAKESKLIRDIWIEDCSIATENIYLEAFNQGLGTCFCQVMGAKNLLLKDSEEIVRGLLGVPNNVRILCIMPIGYPNEKKEKHAEDEFDRKKVHQEKY
jgi:nitroreductase